MRKDKRKICVVTGSRADYGHLFRLMKDIDGDKALLLQTTVTGMHLSDKFGLTYKQIVKDGFKIDEKVDIGLNSDKDTMIALSTGKGVIGFAKAFARLKPDIVVLLGDRFEILAAAVSAVLCRIPIAHIHGGEVTEGAYDNQMRHAITKMAYLHFTAHRDYARRVIQMGEDPRRVFNFGAPGLDNIKKAKLLKKQELERSLGVRLGRDIALVTFHPVTMEKGQAKSQVKNLLKALSEAKLRVIFTAPNADTENAAIFKEIALYAQRNSSTVKLFKSLGQIKYLSLMQYIGLMIGNSSSAITEAPSFKFPVINIGSRQKGRIKPQNIIDSGYDTFSIVKAIKKARSLAFKCPWGSSRNPFGDGDISTKIKNELKNTDISNISKGFYDLKK